MNKNSMHFSLSWFVTSLLLVTMLFTFLLPKPTLAKDSLFNSSSSVVFSNDDEFLSVDQAFSLYDQQVDNIVTVSLEIAPEYYLYKKQFRVTGENVTVDSFELPLGKDHEDEFFGLQQIYQSNVSFPISISDVKDNASLTIRYQGCADKGLCYPPVTKTFDVYQLANASAKSSNSTEVLSAINQEDNQTQNDSANSTASEQFQLAEILGEGDLWLTLVAFFIGGLLLSFTPCVFPMYPILTGIIVGQKEQLSTKHAFFLSFVYVQGMAITYTILGIVVALAGAQFQAMFQHPAVLIVLSVVFIFLALSMFGVFNLALPSSWQNKLSNLSNKQSGGSTVGVLMMGAISGLVASPCTTAPLTGALLYISQSGDIALGAFALYALSLGMGLPLLLLGSSGGKLLPKAGNWMTVIKNIFGLLLLAVPIFLLERFIPEIATELLWALLVLATGGYFYVVNQSKNNGAGSVKGFWFGLRSVVIFVILFLGTQKLYTLFQPESAASTVAAHGQQMQHFTRVANLSELEAAIIEANNDNKTVMVDLYADWCIACKEFEEYTFTDKNVQKALTNTVLLQVDLTDTGSDESIELMGKFDVFGLPSILFFSMNAEELSQQRVTGFMGAEEFTAHVNSTFKQ